MHIKLKHPSVKYDNKYQFQARQASAALKKAKIDDEEMDDMMIETSLLLSGFNHNIRNNEESIHQHGISIPMPTLSAYPTAKPGSFTQLFNLPDMNKYNDQPILVSPRSISNGLNNESIIVTRPSPIAIPKAIMSVNSIID